MTHEIESMAYFGKRAWHGLGTALEESDLYDWRAACRKAGLDWTVEMVPLVTHDTHEASDHRAVRRQSDGRILGTVGPRFEPLQNQDAFAWFQPFLDTRQAALHTAGSLRGGTRVWVLAKLNRSPLVIAKGDEVEKYILLSHGHDGSLAVRCGFTPVRVVCANTLAMSHGSAASKLIRVRHTKSVQINLDAIRDVMDLANQEFEATAEQYRRLANKNISRADLRKYVRRVLEVEDEEKVSTRTANQIEAILRFAEVGRGNDLPGVQGTLWAAYNGVAEWLAYSRGHNADSRTDSLWFGDSATVNHRALETAIDMAI